MKRLITLSLFAIFLQGCEEIVPEYTPYFDEPSTENRITVDGVPRIADDGTIWYVSDESKKVYWLKDGVIKSLPNYSQGYWVYGYQTLGNDFYYLERNFLFKHSYDSVTVLETPLSSFTSDMPSGDYTIDATDNNIILRSPQSRTYYVLTDSGWEQKAFPSSITYNTYYNEFSRGNYILFEEDHKIYNILTQEVSSFETTFPDEWGTNVTPRFDRQCFDQDGNAYGLAGYRLIRRNRTAQTTEAINITVPGVTDPSIKLVRVSANNDIWVIFTVYNDYYLKIYKVGADSFIETDFYYDGYQSPSNVFAHSDGFLWINYNNTIYMYNETSQLVNSTILNFSNTYFDPEYMIFEEDQNGSMWLGEYYYFDSSHQYFQLFKYNGGIWTDYSEFFTTSNY